MRRSLAVAQDAQGQRTLSKGQGHDGVISIRNSGGGILGLENCFQQLLELKCQIRNGGECGVYSIRHSIECSLSEQGGNDRNDEDDVGEGSRVEQELKMLNEELRNIELECQSIMQAHQLHKSHQRDYVDPLSSPGWSPKESHKRHGRLADIHEYPEKSDGDKIREKDSSSAYNTAESARSTPLGVERSPDHSLQRHISITNQKNLRLASSTSSSPIPIPKSQSTPSRSSPADPSPIISSSPDQSNPSRSESDPALPADDERCDKKGRTRESRRGLPYASSYLTSPYQSQGGSRQLQVGRIRKLESVHWFLEASHSFIHCVAELHAAAATALLPGVLSKPAQPAQFVSRSSATERAPRRTSSGVEGQSPRRRHALRSPSARSRQDPEGASPEDPRGEERRHDHR